MKVVNIEEVQTDVGPIVNTESNRLDPNLTFDSFSKWIQGENEWISREMAALGSNPSPDLVVTDISPIALKLAAKIGCPCVTVANFSWLDLLKPLPHNKEKEMVLDWLSECFAIPDLVVKLPFSMRMEGFRSSRIKDASLLYRRPTLSIDETKREIGSEKNKPLIVISSGGHIPPHLDLQTRDAQVVLLSPFPTKMDGRVQVIVGHPESQNIVHAADFVITKAGYSTLAECVAFRCPLNIIARQGYPEDVILIKEASMLGIGSEVPPDGFNHYSIAVPDMDEIRERRKAIQDNRINEFERLTSASELIRNLL